MGLKKNQVPLETLSPQTLLPSGFYQNLWSQNSQEAKHHNVEAENK